MTEISQTTYEAVKDEYLTQIKLPKTKPATQYILCPIGLVGAGKTTVVKPLAEKLNLVRISGDEIRKLLKEKGYGYEKVYDIAFELIQKFLQEGWGVAIDSDCASKIKLIKEKTKGIKLIWIHINPPESFILNKLSNLKPNWLGTAEEMVANYYDRKSVHENIQLDYTYIFDTSLPDISEQITNSVGVIQSKVEI